MIKKRKSLTDVKPKKLRVKRTPEPINLLHSKVLVKTAVFYKPKTITGKTFRMEVVETKMQGFKPISRPTIVFFAESNVGYGQLKRILKAYQAGKIKRMYVDAKTWDK